MPEFNCQIPIQHTGRGCRMSSRSGPVPHTRLTLHLCIITAWVCSFALMFGLRWHPPYP